MYFFFLLLFQVPNLGVTFSLLFVCVFSAAERAERGGGRAAAQVVQPGWELHDGAVCLHRGCAAAVPRLPHPQLRADRAGLRRVGGTCTFPKSVLVSLKQKKHLGSGSGSRCRSAGGGL